jgi:hypothetical protein
MLEHKRCLGEASGLALRKQEPIRRHNGLPIRDSPGPLSDHVGQCFQLVVVGGLSAVPRALERDRDVLLGGQYTLVMPPAIHGPSA